MVKKKSAIKNGIRKMNEFDVATAYEGDEVYDHIGNWETAIQMANDGYRIVVHKGDGLMSRSELQSACDRERELVADCFGPSYIK